MFDRELDQIRASEAEADDIVRQAGSDSRTLIAETNAKASECIARAEKDAEAIVSRYKAEGTEIADRAYQAAMDETGRRIEAMREHARENTGKAVRLISERIVSTSVNR